MRCHLQDSFSPPRFPFILRYHPPAHALDVFRVRTKSRPTTCEGLIAGVLPPLRTPADLARAALDELSRYNGVCPWPTGTLAMAHGDGGARRDAGVATQTPNARAVRSMHPEVALARAGSDNLDLIRAARWRTRSIHSWTVEGLRCRGRGERGRRVKAGREEGT